ncbi:hypothetical protein RHCRD62_50397 [Rhodococcus sp. RD6.2]|nr:hypothetical protein RHCRD62_50397 [Rhodococcus sp. RD6.2]
MCGFECPQLCEATRTGSQNRDPWRQFFPLFSMNLRPAYHSEWRRGQFREGSPRRRAAILGAKGSSHVRVCRSCDDARIVGVGWASVVVGSILARSTPLGRRRPESRGSLTSDVTRSAALSLSSPDVSSTAVIGGVAETTRPGRNHRLRRLWYRATRLSLAPAGRRSDGVRSSDGDSGRSPGCQGQSGPRDL